MEESSRAISPSAAIIAIVVTFVIAVFAGAALTIFGLEVALVLSEPLLMVAPLGYMLYKRVKIGSYIRFKAKPLHILLGVVLGGVVFLFDVLITILLVFVFGPSEAVEESNRAIMEISSSPDGFIAVVVALSLAGICEEFTFRGFLQNAINSKYSFPIALIVSSLAFGLFHVDFQGLYTLSAFLIGLVLGLIYYRWRSYTVSAVTHSTVNLIALAIMLLA